MKNPFFLTSLSHLTAASLWFLSVENLKRTWLHVFFFRFIEFGGMSWCFLIKNMHPHALRDGIFCLSKLYWWFTLLVQLLSRSVIKSATHITNSLLLFCDYQCETCFRIPPCNWMLVPSIWLVSVQTFFSLQEFLCCRLFGLVFLWKYFNYLKEW